LRIAHVITGLEVGGAEVMLHKLLGAMDRKVFEPLVIALVTPGPMAERIRALGIEVKTLGMRRGLPEPRALARLVGLLRHFCPDLVQTWMYHADLLGTLAAPLAHRPIVVWNIRQSDLDPRLTRRGTRIVARIDALLSHFGPDHIICCSHRAREIHRALGYQDRILSVIPNGFDLDRFRPDPEARAAVRADLGISGSAPLVGLVARFDPQKDLPTFIRAAALTRASCPDCRFLLCGRGMDAASPGLWGWITDAGLADAVSLVGPRDDTPRVLTALDVLVSSSAYGEGFPNVIGEAMACGVPCAVTDVGDSGLIVGDTGLTVPPRDSRSLAAAIQQLLDEGADQRARRGQAARTIIASQYSLPSISARYADLYQSLHRGAA
jgi:glycosyltransferase involved in cell wall biosynthesis